MRLKDITIWFVSLLLTVTLLIVAGRQLDYINSQRQKMNLIINEPLENAPPSLAFATVAMGSFRGLIVDILWMRADRLKEQGQFFDARQLADWITVLQPRFIAVWEFQAWNMAYNISVALPQSQPEERWRWVKNGYEILRDQGIQINPKSTALYRQIAWIFQDKIGSVKDYAHKYYKLQLALSIQPLLGPADNAYFQALAQAPTEWDQVLNDPNFSPLITALKAADIEFQEDSTFVGNYMALRKTPARYSPEAFEVIDKFRATPTLEKFDIYAKAHQLRTVWKLDPVLMQQINQKFGPIDIDIEDSNKHLPLDWRHPDVHAIYWSIKGLETVISDDSTSALDRAKTDRMVNYALQNLFRYGKIFIHDAPVTFVSDPNREQNTSDRIFYRPDLRIFDIYNDSLIEVLDKYQDINPKSIYKTLQDGHRNMLKNAVASFYQSGHVEKAGIIYDDLRKRYPLDEFKVPLAVYVKNRIRDELYGLNIMNAREMVQMMLHESYFRYAMRDDDQAAILEKMAKEVYDTYHSMYSEGERVNLPKFKLLKYVALIDFFNDQQFPLELRQSLIARIKLEMPDLARQLEQTEKKLTERSGNYQ